MWYKKSILPAAAVLVAATAFSANQAYALNDDEAAVLVGLAVGTVAAVATKHHREHDRRDWEYRERVQYQPRYDDRYEHRHGQRPPQRVEHYVIHNPPAYGRHNHDRYCDHPGKAKGHYKSRNDGNRGRYDRVGYEYEYEYKRRVNF